MVRSTIHLGLLYLQNDFKDNNDGTITDYQTYLMWEKSGSLKEMLYEDALEYIEKLNHEKFANYGDWRLPTVDELASLLDPDKQSNNLHIDPIFDKTQRWCWTSDKYASDRAWYINFNNGTITWNFFGYVNYVRAVRSIR